MLVPFENLPDHSRIWIYQASRSLISSEVSIISDELSAFINGWAAHGIALNAGYDIRFNQFIILAADEHTHGASGCSIDDSVRKIKELGRNIGVDLFDRTQIAFLKSGEVITIKMENLKIEFSKGGWNGSTPVFNNVITTKGEMKTGWVIPAETTWLKRYLPAETIAS